MGEEYTYTDVSQQDTRTNDDVSDRPTPAELHAAIESLEGEDDETE